LLPFLVCRSFSHVSDVEAAELLLYVTVPGKGTAAHRFLIDSAACVQPYPPPLSPCG
jgi:hypothetical protein